MSKISIRYAKALDWLLYYEEYFYTDPKTKRMMMKLDAPKEAAESFKLYKEANNLHYNHISKEI